MKTLAILFCFYFFQDEHIKEIHNMIEMEDEGTEAKFKQLFEQVQQGKRHNDRID